MIGWRALVMLAVAGMPLAACAGGGPGTPPGGGTGDGFATPLSNQVEVHREDDGHDGPGSDHDHGNAGEAGQESAEDGAGAIQVTLVPSELVVGPNRFAIGLHDADGQVIHDADVRFLYFDTSEPERAVMESEAEAHRLETPDGATTIFAHERTFERAGDWGVEVRVTWPDGRAGRHRISFQVLADSEALAPGERAPNVHTPAVGDVDGQLGHLTSALEPDPGLHEIGLETALSNGKPTLVLFATPAYCQTRFCGPAYEIASELRRRFGDRLNFVYAEVYDGLPEPAETEWRLAPAVAAFGLRTEPWIYLIDAEGEIVYRVEGMFTADEVEAHVHSDLGL